MSSISFQDFTLNQTAITGKRNTVVNVVAVRPRYKIDNETRQRTDIVEAFTADIVAAHGKTQSIKLPLDTEPVIKQISDALKDNKIVSASFGEPSSLRGKCYAMLDRNSNQLIQGVSCTASEIQLVKIEDPEDDFDDLIIE